LKNDLTGSSAIGASIYNTDRIAFTAASFAVPVVRIFTPVPVAASTYALSSEPTRYPSFAVAGRAFG